MIKNNEWAQMAQISMATYFKDYEPLVWRTEGHHLTTKQLL